VKSIIIVGWFSKGHMDRASLCTNQVFTILPLIVGLEVLLKGKGRIDSILKSASNMCEEKTILKVAP